MSGRVMALYSLMFLGLAPLGNFEIGFLSEHFGTSLAIQVGLFFVFLFTLFVFFTRNKTRAKQEAYTQANS
jgi:MFS-type transporter involved in bile tolerance (Atg22 family)